MFLLSICYATLVSTSLIKIHHLELRKCNPFDMNVVGFGVGVRNSVVWFGAII